ncbi:PREDICTED: transmembrane protein 108-like [Myotis brandtii]|uniref:transmembrane protein 108-like n=1 Tax=Myotis brandtii TaxID=109478 RepID=UPI0007041F9D|nr:PREDICTED: transmembrane protein 108-like [Myotis brandtii]
MSGPQGTAVSAHLGTVLGWDAPGVWSPSLPPRMCPVGHPQAWVGVRSWPYPSGSSWFFSPYVYPTLGALGPDLRDVPKTKETFAHQAALVSPCAPLTGSAPGLRACGYAGGGGGLGLSLSLRDPSSEGRGTANRLAVKFKSHPPPPLPTHSPPVHGVCPRESSSSPVREAPPTSTLARRPLGEPWCPGGGRCLPSVAPRGTAVGGWQEEESGRPHSAPLTEAQFSLPQGTRQGQYQGSWRKPVCPLGGHRSMSCTPAPCCLSASALLPRPLAPAPCCQQHLPPPALGTCPLCLSICPRCCSLWWSPGWEAAGSRGLARAVCSSPSPWPPPSWTHSLRRPFPILPSTTSPTGSSGGGFCLFLCKNKNKKKQEQHSAL